MSANHVCNRIAVCVITPAGAVAAQWEVDLDAPTRPPVDVSLFLSGRNLPSVEVYDSNDRLISLESILRDETPALLILFSPSDCPTCLNEAVLWDSLARSGHCRVLPVASTASLMEYRQWERIVALPFPVYVDTSFALIDSLRPTIMPIKILLNPQLVPVWADPSRLTNRDIQAFWEEWSHALDLVY